MFLVAFLSVASYAGYSAYDYVTMSDAERFLLQNIEALTGNEPGGGGGVTIEKTCYHEFEKYEVGADLYHVCGSQISANLYGCGQIVDNKPKVIFIGRCIK